MLENKNNKFKVICITGSSGKTTLKDWLSQVLSKELNIYSNQETLIITLACHFL